MKAIHNHSAKILINFSTVFNTSKIQNESNSQHSGDVLHLYLYCVQYVKDTK